MLKKIRVMCGLLAVTACSSIDNSTYTPGAPGVTDDMVEQQKLADLPYDNYVFVVGMILALGALLNDHGGGFTGQPLPP